MRSRGGIPDERAIESAFLDWLLCAIPSGRGELLGEGGILRIQGGVGSGEIESWQLLMLEDCEWEAKQMKLPCEPQIPATLSAKCRQTAPSSRALRGGWEYREPRKETCWQNKVEKPSTDRQFVRELR